jgi:hypothetical protein
MALSPMFTSGLSIIRNYLKTLSLIVFVSMVACGTTYFIIQWNSSSQAAKPTTGVNPTPAPDNKENYSLSTATSVQVGINSKELKGFHASAFSDCVPQLKRGDIIWLTNESDDFSPTIRLMIDRVIVRDRDISGGQIFVSKEAMQRLGIFKSGRPGIVNLLLRTADSVKGMAGDKGMQPGNVFNFNLPPIPGSK